MDIILYITKNRIRNLLAILVLGLSHNMIIYAAAQPAENISQSIGMNEINISGGPDEIAVKSKY